MRIVQFVTITGTITGALHVALLPAAVNAQGAGQRQIETSTRDGESQKAPQRAVAELLPYPLAADVVLRTPGTSRFAGEYRGVDEVTVALDALCATSIVSGAQAFAPRADGAGAEGVSSNGLTKAVEAPAPLGVRVAQASPVHAPIGALVLLRTAQEGHRRLAWHEVLLFRLDASQRITSIELYVEDQRAWDHRFPREDGVVSVSVVTERNVAAARGRVREARFVAGNADRVVAVIDMPRDPGQPVGMAATTLVQETIAPNGLVRERMQFVSVPMLVGARK